MRSGIEEDPPENIESPFGELGSVPISCSLIFYLKTTGKTRDLL